MSNASELSEIASAITIDSSKNVGIGTSAPVGRLDIGTSAGSPTSGYYISYSGTQVASFTSNASTGEVRIGATNGIGTFFTTFYSNNTERMRIDSSGRVCIGLTTGYGGISLDKVGSTNSSIWINSTSTSNNYMQFEYLGGGKIGSITYNGSLVLYNQTSDYRLKTVIGNINDAGQRIDALQPIEYDWNTGGRTRGFLAHQFAEIYPNSVSGEKDAVDEEGKPVYQAMQASSPEVMADLIAEIQSLRKRIATLEAK